MANRVNPHTQSENVSLALMIGDGGEYCRNTSNLAAYADVSPSLPQLLSLLECPKVARLEMERLEKMTPRHHLEALVHLWQSLGRLSTGLWRETRVFYNRISIS